MATGEYLAAPNVKDRVEAAREHLKMRIEWKGKNLGIAEMKRHYTNYFKGIAHFKEFRTKLVSSFDLDEILATLDYIENHQEEFIFV